MPGKKLEKNRELGVFSEIIEVESVAIARSLR
jgi:hypothetical protein